MSSRKVWTKKLVRLSLAVCLMTMACSSDGVEVDGSATSKVSPDRQRVRDFWKSYREATRLRLEGDFSGAISRYQEALVRQPRHEDALYYLGNVALEVGDWQLAEQSWQELLSENPHSSRAYAQLGNLYLCRPATRLFDVSKAEGAFRESVRLNREETGAVLRLGEAFVVAGQLDSAEVYLDAVIGSNPASTEAVFVRSYVNWSRGNEETPRTVGAAASGSAGGPDGEGDTRTGTGPMLAPGAGCPLFEFEEESTQEPLTPDSRYRRFDILDRRLAAARLK